ncbi:mitochondrial enolase superfamily member 1 [Lingula anatina]|uniref:Mitochondrial enolase superfamily member 1 n=1 Tax=Lingula anatina TaxID=7574 RepID=A0A1S3HDV3_LINAN|nr:mitochondrial enolase superfamily member 1 [Lingula anatina]|eukprot:XP_013384237.1 mitochondrial enolase superfamily member 1 [Lingula anatina]
MAVKITGITARDIRFPTSLEGDGSDAIHTDPDYSCAYITLTTSTEAKGFGHTFTIGRGTEIVCEAAHALGEFVVGKHLQEITADFAGFWRALANDSQLRWLGPEKGVVHLATCAIVNAVWDLWAKVERKPLWKLLADMTPEELVSVIDFRYISDLLTREEALEILKKGQDGKKEREAELISKGYPAYITSAGWSGYDEQKTRQKCKEALAKGFVRFKAKVGTGIEADRRRLAVMREEIGYDKLLMTDANQRWDVSEAIDWMKQLTEFKPLWIEEPTSPDDVLGHATIAKALKPYNIAVATGEHCQNRVVFKQLFQADSIAYCQIDGCRLGGVNEVLAVLLMAAKLNVPVCPHAGGVGLCQVNQHFSYFDYICVSRTLENRFLEYAEHLHENYKFPVEVKGGHYVLPQIPGFQTEMREASLDTHEYPIGPVWQKLFAEGTFKPPKKH